MSLEALLLPQPLPAVVAALIGAGVFGLGERLADLLGLDTQAPARSLAVFPILGAVSTLLFLVTAGNALSLWPLRALALAITLGGSARAVRAARTLTGVAWRDRTKLLGTTAPLMLAALLLYLLWALKPVSATDSLLYHLAAPLENLRAGGLWEHPDFPYAPLAGAGEQWNLLGLAAGTDSLGSFLQWLGLLLLLRALVTGTRREQNVPVVVLTVLSMPLLAHHETFSPKFHLLPAAGLAIALLVSIDPQRRLEGRTLALTTGAIFFAIACRHSFLVPGGIVFLVAATRAYQAGLLRPLARATAAAFVLFPLPFYVKNLARHGDPLYPALTAILTGDDSLKLSKLSNLANLFPFDLVLPLHGLNRFDAVLGLGLAGAGFLVVHRQEPGARDALLAAAGALLAMALLAPGGTRFFVEVLLFVAVGLATLGKPDFAPSLFRSALALQLAAALAFTALVASVQVPGILSGPLRERALSHAARGYQETRWLNEVLDEPGALARPNVGLRAYLERRSYSYGYLIPMGETGGAGEIGSRLDELDVHFLEVRVASPDLSTRTLKPYFEHLVARSPELYLATTNPFKRRSSYRVEVWARSAPSLSSR
jgi:hypothetical protein